MKRHSILIVEDDPAMLRGLTDNFRSQDFDVRTAMDGHSAIEQAIGNPADLILLDIMLPGANGYEICRQVRQQQVQSTIIMLTAKGQEEDIIRGLELGADDYVTKPFSIRELLARAKAFLRRRTEGNQAVVTFGSFVLDLQAHTLMRNKREVSLTSKEFRLLEYMASRPGRALTRGDILDAVWGANVIVTLRSVDRCVTTLRGKIEEDPRQPVWIKTIRDVGYRFESL